MTNPQKIVRYQGNHEWSALYVDGELLTYGDHYIIDEKIAELFGIEMRYDDNFLASENDIPFKTLAEIEEFEEENEEFEEENAEFIAAAENLRGEAMRLANDRVRIEREAADKAARKATRQARIETDHKIENLLEQARQFDPRCNR